MIGQMIMAATLPLAGGDPGEPEPGPVDPNWASVVLLLNGDTLADATGRHTLTQFGNGGDVTASSSGLVFGGNAALRIEGGYGDFAFGAGVGSVTIEARVLGIQAGAWQGARMIASNYAGAAGDWEFYGRGSNSGYRGGFYSTAGAYLEPVAGLWVDGTEHDVAFTYDAETDTSSLYLDGQRIDVSDGPSNYGWGGSPLFVGRESAGSEKFWIGNMRLAITKDVCKMSGDSYTPEPWPRPTRGP